MNRSFFVRIFLVFFLIGVGLGPAMNWGNVFLCFFVVMVAFIWSIFVFKKIHMSVLVGGIAFVFGVSRFLMAVPVFSQSDIAFYRDLPFEVTISGSIADDPYQKNGSMYAIMETTEVSIQGKTVHVRGRVQLKLFRYPAYNYGDQLKVVGFLEKPFFENGEFYVVMSRPKVVNHSATSANVDFIRFVFVFKNFLMERLEQLFAQPDSSMAAGILLGARSGIPSQLLDNFNTVGLTHILAISGYNITLIIQLLALALKSIPRVVRFAITVLVLLLFVLLTGFSASVIRAAFMGGLSLTAALLYRRAQGLQVLLLSGFIMVMIDPFLVPFDISFQLSFMATLGLLLFMPLFENLQGMWLKVPAFVKEGLLVTVSAQLLTIPVILYHFGRMSLISFFSNVVLLPFIPFLMFFSFVALLSSLLFLWPFALVAVSAYWVCMRLLLWGVDFFASIPFASVNISFFPWWMAFLYYILLGVLWFRTRMKQSLFLVNPNRS